MNDSIRTQYYARLGIVPQGSPDISGLESAQGRTSSSAATENSNAERGSMASVRSTLPPNPSAPSQVASSEPGGGESANSSVPPSPVAGVDTEAIQKGLQSAEKVGVKAAKLTFWGKLAGTAVTGLGLVAFGLLTGGAGPLAVAGLALTSAFFLKSCADVHMSRLQLQNAKALAAGEATPPHDLPCGPDAVAHMLYRPFSKWASKGIDPNDTVALERAKEKAKNWAKGLSVGLELTLGVSAVAVTGVSTGKVAESLGFLGVRVMSNTFTSLVVRTPPEKYQQESLDLARRDLTHVEQQLQSIDIGPPPTSNDPDALALYREKHQTMSALQERFARVKGQFEEKLQAYREGIRAIDPTSRADLIDGISTAMGAGADGADLGVGIVEHVSSDLGVFASLGMTMTQLTRSLLSTTTQASLEERLTNALLEMDKDLKRLNKDALEFNTMLGMIAPEFPTAELAPPQLLEPIRVLAD